jgi:CHAT domain-containing protein
MSVTHGYRLDWDAGAFAEVDVFRPEVVGALANSIGYQLQYTPPFRGTFRPRVRELDLTTDEINDIVGWGMQKLTRIVNAGGTSRDGSAGPAADQGTRLEQTTKDMKTLGRRLLSILEERRNILNDLRTSLFLSIGMDESLLTYPWELMYDDEFYCLKHKMGRVVNSPGADPPSTEGTDWWGNRLEDFRVLLIDVSQTEIRGDYQYKRLDQAKIEADAIQGILGNPDLGVECVRLSNEEATREKVLNTLNEGRFKIVHFCGHGVLDAQNPRNSSLALFDAHATTRVITRMFSQTRPLLCFINACESTADTGLDPNRPTVYTIGRAFLQTGAYVLGSRWKIDDQAARKFAESFYRSLLCDGDPVGEAVRVARRALFPTDLGWASYVFYGDPRVRFEREPSPTPVGGPGSPG